jgi:hypothetical protein
MKSAGTRNWVGNIHSLKRLFFASYQKPSLYGVENQALLANSRLGPV